MPIYAMNLFDIADQDEYLAYSRRRANAVRAHDGRAVAPARIHECVTGEIAPRTLLALVEWESKQAFDRYRGDPARADLHPHRFNTTRRYIWQLFDRLDDLCRVLRAASTEAA